MEKISIVTVTWNSSTTIDACLNSLEKVGAETFVVDNNSSDDTIGKVTKYPWGKLIKNKSNLGFASANNIALKKIKSEFVFLLNPDAQLVGDALAKMIEFMKENEEVGIVGPKLLSSDGSIQREITRFPALIDQTLILLRLHRLPWFSKLVYPDYNRKITSRDCFSRARYNYEKTQEAEHLMGSALLIRKEVFEKVGLFDENFFLWFEETDLEKRAKEAGFNIVYYPKAQVEHLRSASIKKINPLRRQRIWNKSLRYYFKKHRPRLEQILLEPFIALSYLPAFLQFAVDKLRGRVL